MIRTFHRSLSLLLVMVCAAIAIADRRAPFDKPPRSVRSRPFDVTHTRLQFKIDFQNQASDNRAAHDLKLFEPADFAEFDAVGFQVKTVHVKTPDDKQPYKARFDQRDDKLTVRFDREYPADQKLTIEVEYRIENPKAGLYFVIPDEREPVQHPMVYSQSEPEYARYWFPCFDSPNDRLTSEMILIVPAGYTTLSNGVLKSRQPNDDGTETWHWIQDKPHVTYLISLVVGRFEAYEQKWNDIPITSYVPLGRLADAPRSFDKTPAMMQFFSDLFGLKYPWDKYAQICVEEYMWGGMEHTSATTLNLNTLHDANAHLDVSSDGLVAHELVHQWYGDLITCKDWAELWLNESFATYFTAVWFEHDQGPDEAAWSRRGHAESYLREDKRYRRPIVTYRYPEPGAMFDRHSYPKGARVLHMLRFVLGDDAFYKALRHYTKTNAQTVAETANFRQAIEQSTGKGLNWFFNQWLHSGGHPDFLVSYTYDDKLKRLKVRVRQTQQVDDLTPLFRTPVEIDIATDHQTVTRKVEISQKDQTFDFDVDYRPRRVTFDPRDWILKTLKFDKSKQEWIDQLINDPNLMARVRAVEALEQFKPDADARDALVEAAMTDKFWGLRMLAAETLGKFNGGEARKGLLHVAVHDRDSRARRAAVEALKNFSHDETRQALRKIIQEDPSYFTVAEALTTLYHVDRAQSAKDMLTALSRDSHGQVILRTAADRLIDLDEKSAVDELLKVMTPPSVPDRRRAVFNALARLGAQDKRVIEALSAQLDDSRLSVRRAAASALATTRDKDAIDVLLKRRDKEVRQVMLDAIDDAVKRLRTPDNVAKLSDQIESLEKTTKQLQSKIKALESTDGKSP